MTIFQKPSYREIRPMRDRPKGGPPVPGRRAFRAQSSTLVKTLKELLL